MDGIDLLAAYISRGSASQAQLALDVHCSEGHLSLVLARKRGLSAPLAKRISDATGVPFKMLAADKLEQAAAVIEAAE